MSKGNKAFRKTERSKAMSITFRVWRLAVTVQIRFRLLNRR
nr:MAG TPA: hypothetical protein [Caudoviricetes sp.]